MKPKFKTLLAATLLLTFIFLPATIFMVLRPQVYYSASGGMEPTFHPNSRIFARGNPYSSIKNVKRGDIIIYDFFNKQAGKTESWIKRVVALPGDKIRMSGTDVWINGRTLLHTKTGHHENVSQFSETNSGATYQVQYDKAAPAPLFSTTVPPGKLFCLGDNRDNSYDSRHAGCVPFSSVTDKVGW